MAHQLHCATGRSKRMKTALTTTFILATIAVAGQAQTKGMDKTEPALDDMRRLESVTWDLKTHTLKWTVQKGTEDKGEFISTTKVEYEITPDNAKMKVAEAERGLEKDEAALLHRLLDTISIYCAQSVVWWEHSDEADRAMPEPATKLDRKDGTMKPSDARPTDAKPTDAKPKK